MQFLTIEDALASLGDQLVAEVIESQNRKGLRTSGRSAASTKSHVSKDRTATVLRLTGVAYWRFQQNGRGPNKTRRPSRAMVAEIANWVKRKGLNIPPYAIAMKIARQGIRVPNRFNPGGVLSEPLAEKRVRSVSKAFVRSAFYKSSRSKLFS